MKKKIVILGSTGSIGKCLLNIINKDKKNFDIILLTAHTNYKTLFKQAKKFKVKNVLITDKQTFYAVKKKYKSLKINVFSDYSFFDKFFKKKVDYTMSSIIGIDGLYPTFKMIKYTKTLAIANKETIICGWNLLKNELKKNDTKFIPVDSEHFSIWSFLKSSKPNVEKIYLTASGGPFHKYKFSNLKKIKISDALKHPTWKMGKKITVDSATLMNKVFELIEAKKIFNLSYEKLAIIIHPSSYIHAIIKYKNGLINIVAHDTTMIVPIFNSLYSDKLKKLKTNHINLNLLNKLNFSKAKNFNFPLLSIIKLLPKNDSLFETVLVSANDYLVNLFLNKKIQYTDITKMLIKIAKMKKFDSLKNISPRNLSDIFEVNKITINKIKKFFKK